MTCQQMTSLGVYVLGAAEPRERHDIEAHLAACGPCRAELIRLAPIPGLLAAAAPDVVCHGSSPGDATVAQRSARSGRVARLSGVAAAFAACAAIAAVLIGLSVGQSSPAGAPRAGQHAVLTLSGRDPATHVSATAALTAASWGTSIRLRIAGAPLNVRCRLVVVSATGAKETAGIWVAWRDGPITVPASAGLRVSNIASLRIMAGHTTLVTMRAGPRSVR